MSDRGRACFSVVMRQLQSALHRLCCEHITRNVQQRIKRKLNEVEKGVIRSYYRATSELEYLQCKDVVSKTLPETAHAYLFGIDPSKIVSVFFVAKGIATHGRINSNNVESENSRQVVARHAKTPVETLYFFLETTSELLCRRRVEAMKIVATGMSTLLPPVALQVTNCTSSAGDFKVDHAGNSEFHIALLSTASSAFVGKWSVNTDLKTCTCGRWQDQCIPCEHVVAVKVHTNVNPEIFERDWFSPIFRKESYCCAFEETLHVPRLQDIVLQGPELRRPTLPPRAGPGRVREEKRLKSAGEF